MTISLDWTRRWSENIGKLKPVRKGATSKARRHFKRKFRGIPEHKIR